MKVCLLNESFPPVIDGVVNVMMNYAKYMMRDFGAKIEVGTPEYPDGKYDEYPYKVVAYPSFDTAEQANGYRTGNPLVGKAVSELADFGPDIIHSHCPATATVVARLLREMTGAPIIFTYHTKYDIDIRRAAKIDLIAEETIKAMVGNIEACDDIWVVSDGAGKSLKALGFQGDYRVMNNGVDFAKGRVDKETVAKVTAGYDLPEDVPMFLYVGRLINYKNLPLILDALKILADSGQDFRMVFVGKGPDREILEKKAAELGLMGASRPKVFFTGPVYDRDELRAWNTRADLFLFPSTFDTNGLVVREAAACGLASILVKDSCAAEGITDDRNGFIIGESAEDMAALLKKLCGDLDHVHDVGQHAMDEIYMSWEECVARAYDRYEYILAKKQIGALPHHKKQVTDDVVKVVAKAMTEEDKLRKTVHAKFGDLRGKALKMKEFTKAEIRAGESEDLRWNDILEDVWTEAEELFKK
jgi:glycosyltransferase involved in cell wall biosynthesis